MGVHVHRANIDAVNTAASIGIRRDNAVDYVADSAGTGVMYEAVCAAVECKRSTGKMKSNWSKKISEDYKARK